MIEKFCLAIKEHEGFYPPSAQYPKGSRSWRNHSPGNFRCSKLMTELGAIRCDDNFSVFPNYETGWKALVQFVTYACNNELRAYKDKTIYGFFDVYAPSGDRNTPRRYAEIVAKAVGVSPETPMRNLLSEAMYYSQKDPKWAKEKLGTCSDTLAQSACFVTSFCNLGKEMRWFDYTPSSLNKLLTQEKLYASGCLMVAPNLAKRFGLTYERTTKDPGRICIAETDHYKKQGVPQHFFVYEKGSRIDPLDLDPKWEANDYRIVSYRVFTGKPPVTPTPEPVCNKSCLKHCV